MEEDVLFRNTAGVIVSWRSFPILHLLFLEYLERSMAWHFLFIEQYELSLSLTGLLLFASSLGYLAASTAFLILPSNILQNLLLQ